MNYRKLEAELRDLKKFVRVGLHYLKNGNPDDLDDMRYLAWHLGEEGKEGHSWADTVDDLAWLLNELAERQENAENEGDY